MEFSYAIEKMFNEVLPSLKHGNDGLIFTCRNSAYKFGTDNKMYAFFLRRTPQKTNSRIHCLVLVLNGNQLRKTPSIFVSTSTFPSTSLGRIPPKRRTRRMILNHDTTITPCLNLSYPFLKGDETTAITAQCI